MEKRNLIIFIKTTIIDNPKIDSINDLTNSKYSQIEGLLNRNESGFTIIPEVSEIKIEDHININK